MHEDAHKEELKKRLVKVGLSALVFVTVSAVAGPVVGAVVTAATGGGGN